MIPKTIHYVWVGGSEKPKNIRKCMKTWKRLKGYSFVEWNENNFDINSHPFVKKAYENKQWAFVSDYIRFYVIYHEGGVYFDTDIIVIDTIDEMLNNDAFVGFESKQYPFTAVFGAKKNHNFCKKVLDYYDSIDINQTNFSFNDNNTLSISDLLIKEYGCIPNDKEQMLKQKIKVYESNILCNPSLKSKTIHAFTATWIKKEDLSIKLRVTKKLRANATNKVKIIIYLLTMKIFHYLSKVVNIFANKKID